MTTIQMKYLIELSNTLNFTKASQNLFISQPTLTYQIKEIEKEVGFLIFNRIGKNVTFTPSGRKFCEDIKKVLLGFNNAVEQAQNMSSNYTNEIKIGLRTLSSLKELPNAIINFSNKHSDVLISPYFDNELLIERFLSGIYDCIFVIEEQVGHIPNIYIHKLYDADICLICRKDDSLSKKEMVYPIDLNGRTLLVGSVSSHTLQKAQQEVINTVAVKQLNSSNHNTTLVNVLSNRAICLSPTYYKEDNDKVAWVPFSFDEKISCVICVRDNNNKLLNEFISELIKLYK